MKKIELLLLLVLGVTYPAIAQPKGQPTKSNMNVTCFSILPVQNSNVGLALDERWQSMTESLGNQHRGFFGDMFSQTKGQVQSQTTTTITGIINSGMGLLVTSLFETPKQKKRQWESMLRAENRFYNKISDDNAVKDFYEQPSTSGALDPKGMKFNGFRLSQSRGDSLVLYFSCHIDTTAEGMRSIFMHSKFKLVVDSLFFRPSLCDLPCDSTARDFHARRRFSWIEKDNLQITLSAEITSSWITEATEVFKDVLLGNFSYTFPISQNKLQPDGTFRYPLGNIADADKIRMQGDCFIVPRSYIGIQNTRDQGTLPAWGTGRYQINAALTETCAPSDEYIRKLEREGWKADYKRRRKASRSRAIDNFKMVMVHAFDPRTQITTLIQTPSTYATREGLRALGLLDESGQVKTMSASAVKGGNGNPNK